MPALHAPSPTRRSGDAAATRVFLVGCPRSGTTLLQSMLFGHPEVASFPETFFFVLATPRRRLMRQLGLSSRQAGEAFERLAELGLGSPPESGPPRRLAACAAEFADRLDRAGAAAGASLWIEKTPSHLRYADQIERFLPDARFLHIVRDGTGTIPSLREVTHDHAGEWGGQRPLAECAERWRADVGLAAARAGSPADAFVSYERLVAAPDEVLPPLCEFLGLEADAATVAAMVAARGERLGRVMGAEPWKRGVAGAIVNDDAAKLERRLDPSERQLVLDAVAAERDTLDRIPFL